MVSEEVKMEEKSSSLEERKEQNMPQKKNTKPQPKRDEAQRNGPKIPVRVKFSKKGRMKYISHLDLLRTMHSAMHRAKMPVWYTEGFNPRAKMVFSLPLSLFTESECEFMDIRLTEERDLGQLRKALDDAFTDELKILEIYPQQGKLSDIAWASYRIRISQPGLRAEAVDRLMGGEIVVTKKSKSGEKTLDIRPLIKEYSVRNVEDGIECEVTLRATSADFLNPEYLIKALSEQEGTPIDDYDILRTGVYCEDGRDFR